MVRLIMDFLKIIGVIHKGRHHFFKVFFGLSFLFSFLLDLLELHQIPRKTTPAQLQKSSNRSVYLTLYQCFTFYFAWSWNCSWKVWNHKEKLGIKGKRFGGVSFRVLHTGWTKFTNVRKIHWKIMKEKLSNIGCWRNLKTPKEPFPKFKKMFISLFQFLEKERSLKVKVVGWM